MGIRTRKPSQWRLWHKHGIITSSESGRFQQNGWEILQKKMFWHWCFVGWLHWYLQLVGLNLCHFDIRLRIDEIQQMDESGFQTGLSFKSSSERSQNSDQLIVANGYCLEIGYTSRVLVPHNWWKGLLSNQDYLHDISLFVSIYMLYMFVTAVKFLEGLQGFRALELFGHINQPRRLKLCKQCPKSA